MRRLLLLVLILAMPAAASAATDFRVLCYHEVRDDVRDYPDPYAVDSTALVRQFAWLRGNGYTPVSMEDIVVARRGGKPLPDKAVLLSFDDGYLSFYTRVYPLLRAFGYPAILGVVGKWIDKPADGPMAYGEIGTVSSASFPTWEQLREMSASGLVEIASHTYDLHRGVLANPQANVQPAATARIYDALTGRYEDDASWRARVFADLARNSEAIERGTGRRPRVIVWPYGSYNGALVRMAGELGMTIALTLEEGVNTPAVPLTAVRRALIEHNPSLAEFALEARGPIRPEAVRVVQLGLDSIYDSDPAQQERNLSALLDRMQALKPTHVYLKATSDTNGDGRPDAAYFPTSQLPLRADLFNRVAWQLASRVDTKIYAVMPVAGFGLPQDRVELIYEDLARHAAFDGLVFEDGAGDITAGLAARARNYRALLNGADGSYNPAGGEPVILPGNHPALARQMRELQLGGRLNFGYAPDDPLHDNPPLARTARAMSLRVHPLAPANAARQEKR